MNASAENSGGTPGNGRGRRWLWPVLTVSLALNLLFVGLMAGSWWRHGGPKGGRNQVFVGAIEQLMPELTQEKKDHAAQLIEQYHAAMKSFRGDLKSARDGARDAILIDPYDEEKVTVALARFREIRNGQHEARHTMFLELMKELSLKERQQLLDNIRAGFRARWGDRKSRKSAQDEKAKSQ